MVTFRGAPALRGRLAPNVLDPPSKPKFFHNLVGFFPCKRCNVCKINLERPKKFTDFISTVDNSIYHIKFFATCTTPFIVYLITCPCNKQYVGRTIRSFAIRVNEHITSIIKGKTNHSVPKHYLIKHNKDPKGTRFQIIDRFEAPWRGASSKRGVSRLETYWIYTLKSYTPFGMNIEWDINSFINKS